MSTAQHGTAASSGRPDPAEGAHAPTPARRRPGRAAPWVRLGLAAVAVAGLLAAAPAVAGRVDLQDLVTGNPDDSGAAATVDPASLAARLVQSSDVTLVETVSLACPGAETADRLGDDLGRQGVAVASAVAPASRVAAVAEGAEPQDLQTGSLRLVPTGADPVALGDALTRRPTEVTETLLGDPTGAVLTGRAGLAPGVSAAQFQTQRPREGRGASLVSCVEATPEQWLVGGDAGSGRAESLLLVNPGSGPVTAEVEVLGPAGRVDVGPPGTIVLPPGGREVVSLDALAPQVERPVVHVSSPDGDVAAYLADRWLDGARDHGQEVVGSVAPPATEAVLPGTPAQGQVALRVAVPGEESAVVEVDVLGPTGTRTLETQSFAADAGASTQVDLTDLPAETASLRVRSDVPVLAAAQVSLAPEEVTDGRPGTTGELAWVGASEPISALAGTPLVSTERTGLSSLLVLANPAEQVGEVRVHRAYPDGRSREDTATVPPGASATVDLAGADQVWITPVGDGDVVPVHGAVVAASDDGVGPMLSVMSLVPAPVDRTISAVLPAPHGDPLTP